SNIDDHWFKQQGFKADDLATAVYYHDIGKVSVAKDCLYIDHCNTNAKRAVYYTHLEEGLKQIQDSNEILLGMYKDNTLEKMLYYAILDHHEHFDGTGHPSGKSGEEISFVARLTAVVDAFDNLLFVGRSNQIDFEGAVKDLQAKADKQLDGNIIEWLLLDVNDLKSFVSTINTKERDGRKKDRYGTQLRYRPIMDIRDNDVDSYLVDVVINDAYYGILPSSVFIPIAEKTGQVALMQKMALERMFIHLEKMSLKGIKVPEVAFFISARVIEKKNFFKDVDKLINKYRMVRSKLAFVVSETSIMDFDVNFTALVNEVHSLGVKFILSDFGDQVSLISANDNIQVDGVMFKSMYGKVIAINPRTYSVVSGIARIAEKLNIPVIMDGITDSNGEDSALKMQVKYACGDRYGEPITDAQLFELLRTGGANG
ncbi:MAG: EAL domain-containing protein, partial [Clostridia bacterium]|nr:EAL domain-containing protein [Clostridia bacterium]